MGVGMSGLSSLNHEKNRVLESSLLRERDEGVGLCEKNEMKQQKKLVISGGKIRLDCKLACSNEFSGLTKFSRFD